jgi:hypothetical protein
MSWRIHYNVGHFKATVDTDERKAKVDMNGLEEKYGTHKVDARS